MSSLDGLRAGDPFVVSGDYRGDRIERVVRMTPTQIIDRTGCRWSRKSGRPVGESGVWSRLSAWAGTPEELERVRGKQEARDLRAAIPNMLKDATLQQLRDAAKALDPTP